MPIPTERLEPLMRLAVREAARATPEDERVHPKVGAVLADGDGKALLSTHRGQEPGLHAEYALLESARKAGIDTRGCTLFATLEPCISRSGGKIPCAERIAAAGLAGIYIGTLDPNPNITGRGETFLSYRMFLGRFPAPLAAELRTMNAAFFEHHRKAHEPVASIYASTGIPSDTAHPKPQLGEDRNHLLQQTLDLVSGDGGDVWVRAGDLSWWREAQFTFLGAALDGREVRVMAHCDIGEESTYQPARRSVLASGASLVDLNDPPVLKGTLVSPGTDRAAMALVDRRSVTLLRSPDDSGLLGLVTSDLTRTWDNSAAVGPIAPRLESLEEDQLVRALTENVPQYDGLAASIETVSVDEIVPLTRHLERFKLFRSSGLEAIRTRHGVPRAALIVGSPWPITPPVVERRADGSLVVVDGTHRVYTARELGDSAVEAVVVDGCDAPLPAEPAAGWQLVSVYNTKLPRERRYDDYRPSEFREIRAAFETLATE